MNEPKSRLPPFSTEVTPIAVMAAKEIVKISYGVFQGMLKKAPFDVFVKTVPKEVQDFIYYCALKAAANDMHLIVTKAEDMEGVKTMLKALNRAGSELGEEQLLVLAKKYGVPLGKMDNQN